MAALTFVIIQPLVKNEQNCNCTSDYTELLNDYKVLSAELYRISQERVYDLAANTTWPLWNETETIAEYGTRTGLKPSIIFEINGIEIELILIPAGIFTMGNSHDDEDFEFDELPHLILIDSPFYLGKYEITQAQWTAVMGNNPSFFVDPRKPVDSVSWTDINHFLEKAGHGLNLPTEEQWEWACRAGTYTKFHSGDTVDDLKLVAWSGADNAHLNSENATSAVGLKRPNSWGLYDMHGNVSEWCLDEYECYAKKFNLVRVNQTPINKRRVLRGGAWFLPPAFCRSSKRMKCDENSLRSFFGFRVAYNIENKISK